MADSEAITFSAGTMDDLAQIQSFLRPFMEAKFLLERTEQELITLLTHSYVARKEHEVVGFGAVEIYSKKLAEIQCLAVSPTVQRQGVGRAIVKYCVNVARENKVKELMAISATDAMFLACGFDYSLNKKRALFISPMDESDR